MTAWSDGYVVDVPYLESAFPELTPAWLSMTSVLNGQPPLDTKRPLTYVELGCGNGLSSCVVAATCPQLEVWACDFNPAHVERARRARRPRRVVELHDSRRPPSKKSRGTTALDPGAST